MSWCSAATLGSLTGGVLGVAADWSLCGTTGQVVCWQLIDRPLSHSRLLQHDHTSANVPDESQAPIGQLTETHQ